MWSLKFQDSFSCTIFPLYDILALETYAIDLKSPAGDGITHELLYNFLFEPDGFFHLSCQNGQCFTETVADGKQEGCQLMLTFQQQQEIKKK